MFQKQDSTNRLGTAPVGRLLASLALPAILGQIVSLLYNLVDRMFIGRIADVGSTALTGIGVATPIVILLSAFACFVGIGGAPLAAIAMGAGKKDEAEEYLGNGLALLVTMSVVLTVASLLLNRPLLELFGASQESLPYALDYLEIYEFGTIFLLLATGLNAFISNQGFAGTAMLSISIGALVNIVLDPIFIFGLNMGVKGAALATVISQAMSATWIFAFFLGKKTKLRFRREHLHLRWRVVQPMLALGLSPFIMVSTESLLMLCFNSSLAKYGGDVAVAAMTILSASMTFASFPLNGLAAGAQAIMSYNYGAKKPERMRQVFRLLLLSAVAYTTVFFTLMMLFPGGFARFFTDDPKLVENAAWMLRIYLLGIIPLAAQTACQQSFLALGQAKISIFLALLRKIVLLIPLIYVFPLFIEHKVFAVVLAEPVTDTLAALAAVLAFRKVFREILQQCEIERGELARVEAGHAPQGT